MSDNVFDVVSHEYMGAKKNNILHLMSKSLRQYRDISDDVKKNIILDASKFPRLAFLNPQLLSVALVMHGKNINEQSIFRNVNILDEYMDYLDVNKSNMNGVRNDMLRYIIMVDDYFNNSRNEASELIRRQVTMAEQQYAEELNAYLGEEDY